MLLKDPQTEAGRLLNELVQAYKALDEAWADILRLRSRLVAAMGDIKGAEEVQRFVSLKRKKGNAVESPRLAELNESLRLQAEQQLETNAEQIYKAQLAVQEAEEELYRLSTSESMRQTQAEILLENHRLTSSG